MGRSEKEEFSLRWKNLDYVNILFYLGRILSANSLPILKSVQVLVGVVHTFNPSTEDAEAGCCLGVQHWPGRHSGGSGGCQVRLLTEMVSNKQKGKIYNLLWEVHMCISRFV